ncbi:MAG: aldehyde dehydrogenase family protein [Sphingomonadales bacterium]|nr:aldehyde dehydrogenase family protein [Sphingomonadales bacterium]
MNAPVFKPVAQPPLPAAYRARSLHLIDGKLVEPSGGQWFDAVDPCTGAVIAQIAEGNDADVNRAVAAARAAFEGPWSRFKPSERQACLLKLADLVAAEFDDIALVDTLEMGRPITPSKAFVSMVTRALRHYAGLATSVRGATAPNSSPLELLSYTLREPVGVVGVIIPWNGPVFCAAWKCAPALAAGCTVVMKPSEKGSLTPLRFGELCLEAGIPAGVVNVVTGHGAVGAAISSHPDVNKITFTGSCGTGQKIIAAAAGTVKRVTMELGGKSPNIVFADADLDLAAPAAAMAIFNNSGQVCSAGSRIYVERSIHDEFVERLVAAGRAFRVGHTLDPETQIGPIVSRGQFDRVCSYLELGPQEGARVALGGAVLGDGGFESGFYVPPTVLGDVADDMRVAREEIFGPVACVMPFDGFDEVIARANDTEFGLAAAVWTKDVTRAHQAVKRIRAGTVWVNAYGAMDPAMPFGGYKMSGFGREGGSEHLDSYLETKGVWIRTA